jgi:hypothetical protein
MPLVIFDLDETLIHTTIVDETWFMQQINPGAGRGLGKLRATLSDEGVIRCPPYFSSRLRPGILRGLRRLSSQCALCLCSFGIPSYVRAVAEAIDPSGAIFGSRVFDRSDFPDRVKRVPRLWGDARDAVAVDDQPSVWERGAVVVTVRPYEDEDDYEKCVIDEECYVNELVSNLEAVIQSFVPRQKKRTEEMSEPFGAHVTTNWPRDCRVPLRELGAGPAVAQQEEDEDEEEEDSPVPVLGMWEQTDEENCETDEGGEKDEDMPACEREADNDSSLELIETEEGYFRVRLKGSTEDLITGNLEELVRS